MAIRSHRFRTLALASAVLAGLGAWTSPVDARITRIVINSTTDPDTGLSAGAPFAIKRITGRAFGELDPRDARNAIIQDIERAPKNANGKVEYQATFQLILPSDPANMSGLLWHDVPNRGGRVNIVAAEINAGDVGLSSGWQGDNSGATAQTGTTNDFVIVPVAHHRDGSTITGTILGRIVNRSGPGSQQLLVQNNPLPYLPATLDTTQATLTTHTHETVDGKVTVGSVIPSTDWAWAKCGGVNPPFPGTPDPTQICLKNGFDPNLLYQVVFTAKDPYVLGVGFAAFRDLSVFFKTATQDDVGSPNPVAGRIKWMIARGVSQSGNFLRQFLHLGFNEDEMGRQVYDGAWPIIAGRRIALNFRWAQPDGVLELYEAGSEGPQWWVRHEDHVRHLPARGILDRCNESRTCPKIIEHFGSAEVWALKLTPEWVGTDAKEDIPLTKNIRRYYIPSTTHGGANINPPRTPTQFNASLPGTLLAPPNCPGNNFGTGVFASNPIPHTETVNALRVHFKNWVMHGTPPPPSVWPRLDPNVVPIAGGDDDDGHKGKDDEGHKGKIRSDLVDADKQAMGFPNIPAITALSTTIPSNFIMPVLDYDWGPRFDYSDTSGVPTNFPPNIKRVIRMLVPRVDADGNEIGGVPLVLRDAPLGTYLGWNITAGGLRPFHQGQVCDYTGGMIPFAKTKAERTANGDSRLSLEERYKDHAGYVAAVRAAGAKAVAAGFLLQADADALTAQADASAVLNP